MYSVAMHYLHPLQKYYEDYALFDLDYYQMDCQDYHLSWAINLTHEFNSRNAHEIMTYDKSFCPLTVFF